MNSTDAMAFADRVRAVGPLPPNSPASLEAIIALADEVQRLRASLAASEQQFEQGSLLYAEETKRHNATWQRMEGYRKDLEFAAEKVAAAGLLTD